MICALCIAIPAEASARPKIKIAVAPLTGDPGNKIARAVVDALSGKDFEVVGPRETGREIGRLQLPDDLDGKATRKLASKLGVVAIINGTVGKAGRKRSLHLEVHRRGKPSDGFTIEFKSATSSKFRRALHDEIVKKIEGAGDDPDGEDEATPVAEARRRPFDDDDRERKQAAERKRADDDRERKQATDRKRADDEARRPRRSDDGRRRRVAAADDDDDGERTARKRRGRGDERTLLALRVGAGGSVAQRLLSWELRSGFTQAPPRVQTTAGAGRVDGEVYPFALVDPGSSLAGLGAAAAYDKTLGLSIKVPRQTVSAPINQSHVSAGVRYRLGLGESASVAFGLDYVRRTYIAERGGLMGAVLDAPDVQYSAVAPGAWLRVPVTSSVAVFGGGDGLLIFEAGAIQRSASYGPATVYGVEGTAGVDVAITRQLALRAALEYSQIMIRFTPQGPTLANNRDNNPATQDVMGATDRSIGGSVTVGFVY